MSLFRFPWFNFLHLTTQDFGKLHMYLLLTLEFDDKLILFLNLHIFNIRSTAILNTSLLWCLLFCNLRQLKIKICQFLCCLSLCWIMAPENFITGYLLKIDGLDDWFPVENKQIWLLVSCWKWRDRLDYVCIKPLSTILQLYRFVSFICGGNCATLRKPLFLLQNTDNHEQTKLYQTHNLSGNGNGLKKIYRMSNCCAIKTIIIASPLLKIGAKNFDWTCSSFSHNCKI